MGASGSPPPGEQEEDADHQGSEEGASQGHSRDTQPVAGATSWNKWEESNLGSDEKKDKFLRLMGAKKNPQPQASTTTSGAGTNTIQAQQFDIERQYWKAARPNPFKASA